VWDKYVNAVSEIDVIFSLAKVCKRMAPRCLPKFCIDDENSVLNVKGALHPGLLQVIEP
jgi:DNA mismatch repair ATPase MutS